MKKTVEYRLKGSRRKVGAIGKHEGFEVTVFRHTGTMTPREAMETTRESMYQDGWEHILFKSCEIRNGNAWQGISMLKALGLE